ncbi:MAG: WYL domain-containing protein [Coriobacteriia bacterium]|nr:WYL domain-containing protein [Coriobacteriia bacterium]
MAQSSSRKAKILHLQDILLTETDDENGLTMPQLINRLAKRGIEAERKAIYDDMQTLREFGLDIITRRAARTEYAIGARQFELPELLLLTDAVQSSRFLTERKSKALVNKLQKLTSQHQEKLLKKRIHVEGRIKMQNESIYYNVDTIQEAINQKRRINFHYFEYGIDKREVFRREGREYLENPIDLVYKDEYYYLITFNDDHESFLRYRVDRMKDIKLTEDPITQNDAIRGFDVLDFTAQSFGMFDGDKTTASLIVDTTLIGSVIDRFGRDVPIIEIDGQTAHVEISILKSDMFFGWLAQFGNKVRIEEPSELAAEYRDYLLSVVSIYQ